ncbi:tetratricopeptide repeat protein [Luminiphilus sp.]|nr:tetratricopeptide repeat protein [Luminiphilus sp.]
MTEQLAKKPLERLWANLKERHVTRIALAYLGVGWGLLETAEFVLGILQTPDWVFRAAVAVVGMGFPVALILSWVFDIRGGQVVRAEADSSGWPKWMKAALATPLLALVITSTYWVWTGYVEEKERSLRPTDLGDEIPIVAVLPIRNLTGDPSLDWFGEGIVNLVRDDLSRSRFLRIASPQKLNAIIGESGNAPDIASLAAEQDIGFVMAGEMLMTPAGIYVSTRLTDTAGGVVLSAKQVESLEPATILEAAGPIATQIRRGLGVPTEEQIKMYVADFAIDNLQAYELYVQGMTHLVSWQVAEAEQAFRQALEISPDFGVAHYRLGLIKWIRSETDEALLDFDKALTDPFLLDRERRYIEAYRLAAAYDLESLEPAINEILEIYPFEIEARVLRAIYVHWEKLKPDDAIDQFRQLTAEEPHNQELWAWLGTYQRLTGDLEAAEKSYSRMRRLAPEAPNTLRMLGLLRQAQGDLPAAERFLQQALTIAPSMRDLRYELAVIKYLQGNVAAAEVQLQAIVANQALSIRDQMMAMKEVAAFREARGDFAGANALFEEYEQPLKTEGVWYAATKSRAAINWLELGDLQRAHEFAQVAIIHTPLVPTRYLFARAMIELAEKNFSAVLDTAKEIEGFALPADNPDRTEEKAAAYLRGLAALARDDLATAQTAFAQAKQLEGYEYALYALGYAQAAVSSGRAQEALEIIDAAVPPDPISPRFDLEKDRVRALLLSAEAELALGRHIEAASRAEDFLARFNAASPDHSAVVRAQTIVNR